MAGDLSTQTLNVLMWQKQRLGCLYSLSRYIKSCHFCSYRAEVLCEEVKVIKSNIWIHIMNAVHKNKTCICVPLKSSCCCDYLLHHQCRVSHAHPGHELTSCLFHWWAGTVWIVDTSHLLFFFICQHKNINLVQERLVPDLAVSSFPPAVPGWTVITLNEL